jgi:rhamnulokinase
MGAHTAFLAFDVGASSGRAVVTRLRNGGLEMEEIHRFPNGPVQIQGHVHWNVLQLLEEIKRGIGLAAQRKESVASIGLSTWGVDSALLDREGELLGVPYCYRDSRTGGIMERVFESIPRERIFELTGIQFMPLDTLYQLYATKVLKPATLDLAGTLLMIPDLFNYWLTGRKGCELTDASTTQFLDARTPAWCREIFDRLDLPFDILPEIHPPGTVLGSLAVEVADEVGLVGVPVVAPASHDTASAVAAVPASNDRSVYISCGTWVALGALVGEPVITAQTLRDNFTNERGVEGKYMLRKNIVGLWLLQESRRIWSQAGQSYSYEDLVDLAERAEAFGPMVEPDHPSFLAPGDIPARIQAFCQETGQEPPADVGSIARCILESMALKFRYVLENLEQALGWRARVVHMVGGGCKNELLCQLTADATGRPLLAGPSEATTLGNAVVQAEALGEIGSLEEGRDLIRASYEMVGYEPQASDRWDEFYGRFVKLRETTTTLL